MADQSGMGAQLDEVRVSVVQHAADRRFEEHGGAGVLPPVGGAAGIASNRSPVTVEYSGSAAASDDRPSKALKRSSFTASM